MSYNEVTNDFPGFDDGQPDWIPLASRDKLPLWRVLGIGTVSLIPVMAKLTIFLITLPMLQSFDISRLESGLIWLVYPAAMLLVNPFIMFRSNVTRSWIGRRRPYIILGTIMILVGFMTTFFVDRGQFGFTTKQVRLWAFIGCFTIICIGIQLIEYPSQQIIQDLIPATQYEKACQAIAFAGNLLLGVACLLGYLQVQKYSPKGESFTDKGTLILICIFVISLCFVVCLLACQEEQLTEAPIYVGPFHQMIDAAKSFGGSAKLTIAICCLASCGTIPFYISLSDYFSSEYFDSDSDRAVSFSLGVWAIGFALHSLITLLPIRTFVEMAGIRVVCIFVFALMSVILALFFFVHNKWAMLGTQAVVDVLHNVAIVALSNIEVMAAPSDQVTGCKCLLDSVRGLGTFFGVLIYEVGMVKVTSNVGISIGAGVAAVVISMLVSLGIDRKKATAFNLEREVFQSYSMK